MLNLQLTVNRKDINCITIIQSYLMKWSDLFTRIAQEIQVQKERYSRTKYGKIVALLVYYAAFTYIPQILNVVIPFLTHHMAEKYAYILIMLTTMTIVALSYNISILFIYKSKLPFFEQFRVNPQKPWPWEENKQKWNKLMWRSIGFTAMSIYVIGGLSLLAEVNIDFRTVMDPNKRMDIQWILLQFFMMMLMEDIIFFSTHYAFHKPLLYKYHKIHHEYTTSISIAGLHFHSIQFLITQSFSNLACMKFASLVGPLNISTFVIWIIFRVLDAFNGHCGYSFSWTPLQLLPFCTNDEFHDFHHTQNCGNYGSHFRFWDSIFGTNQQFRQYKKKQLNIQLQSKTQ